MPALDATTMESWPPPPARLIAVSKRSMARVWCALTSMTSPGSEVPSPSRSSPPNTAMQTLSPATRFAQPAHM